MFFLSSEFESNFSTAFWFEFCVMRNTLFIKCLSSPPTTYKIFLLSLVFSSLAMMYLSVNFSFSFVVLGVYWVCGLIFLSNFKKQFVNIYSNMYMFSTPLSLCHLFFLLGLKLLYVGLFDTAPKVLEFVIVCLLYFNFFFSL